MSFTFILIHEKIRNFYMYNTENINLHSSENSKFPLFVSYLSYCYLLYLILIHAHTYMYKMRKTLYLGGNLLYIRIFRCNKFWNGTLERIKTQFFLQMKWHIDLLTFMRMAVVVFTLYLFETLFLIFDSWSIIVNVVK